MPFQKVIVANRGEIAVRILRTLRELRIPSVAVYSDADRGALHVRMADEAYPIGPPPAAQSYLDADRILDAAAACGADGLAPGYGFLAENADFAQACGARGIAFIGPTPDAMRAMGNKTRARAAMQAAGVPVVPGGPAGTTQAACATAAAVGYPVLLKAAAGGGGKGMRRVTSERDMGPLLERARGEARSAFGDDTVYIEKALESPRHVEVQVLGDLHGNLVHLFERDCSLQRRHQKIVEETPCPALPPATLEHMTRVALQAARTVGYHSAGTVEFLLDRSGSFYFLEMNTRLQVEHPITELCTGVDLVERMIRIAEGEPLGLRQDGIERRGAAIECRICAEDPARGFMPSPGTIRALAVPAGPGVRDDSGACAGFRIPPEYDPLVSKLCVWAPTRDVALARMRRALGEYVLTGVRTNLDFLARLLHDDRIERGDYDTAFVERHLDEIQRGTEAPRDDALVAALAVAVHDAERRHRPEQTTRVSPWLAAHRASLLRR
jgi:acetyl-CoA carboxylase biotin carboxylase subunit